jgi:hypothetical protein
MDESKPQKQFPTCPSCGSHKVRRSVRKGAQDFVLRHLLFQVPYRCGACDHRFFSFRQPRHEPEPPAPSPPTDPRFSSK